MVVFPINTGIRKIGDQVLAPGLVVANAKWFLEDITIKLSNPNVIGTVVIDFSVNTSVIVEYTLDGGGEFNWIAFNNGETVNGGQSRFIDVTDGNKVNFRSSEDTRLVRCIVSSVP